MSLKIIIGAAGSGKSRSLVSEMARRSLELPDDKFFVIVPEQATLNMQQSVVRNVRNGATFNIDVVSFNRLAQVVFADLGIDVSKVLDDTGKVLILRQILEECKEDLQVYQKKVHMPGFAQRVKSAITELKQYNIGDNELFLMQESAETRGNTLLYAKLEDLRLITRKFNEKIKDAYRAMEELLVLFAEQVQNSKRLQGSHIYLDGFTGFTPVQYRLLNELLKYAADVTVTITIPEDRIKNHCPEYDLFRLSNQTLSKLSDAAAEVGIPVSIQLAEFPAQGESKPAPAGFLFQAADWNEEVTFAAKEILRLVKEEGLRYREIAVITSDMESYHFPIEKIFHEAGIPCFIDHKSDITDNPLPRYLLSALGLVEQRFSYDSVFTWLKTGLTDIDFEEVRKIENYCLEFGIRSFHAWDNEMVKNRKLYGPEPKEDELKEDRFAGQAWNLDEINRIRSKVIKSVGEFYRAASRPKRTTADYVKALKRLLKKNHVQEKIEALAKEMKEAGRLKEQREYEQVFDMAEDLLDKTLVLSGDAPLSVREYMNMLESGFLEIKVGVIPPTIDTLMVGDLTRTRLEYTKVLFFLGADDGRIPQAGSPAGVFSSRDREFLKAAHFEIAPTASENICNQRFYLYLMLNKPTERLYISYAASGADGEQKGPAYILEEMPELVKGLELQKIMDLPDIRWERQALKELSGQIRKEPDEDLLTFFAKADPDLLKKIVDAAFFSNKQTPLDKQVALDLYGDVLSGSVSRYERFSECPFKHFLTYGLRLEKRPEYEIAVTDVGTIYHSALEKYSLKLEEEGFTFRDVSDSDSQRIAEISVGEAIEEMPSDILDSSARNEFFVKRIKDVTIKTTDILRQQVQAGKFDPENYELEFKDSLSEHVRFKGKIDRVDIYEAGDMYVKIIDYKSGQKAFKVEDIYYGTQLQLVAYLKEAINIYAKENPSKKVRPGGVYFYLINDRFTKTEEEALERFKLSGLTSCEEGLLEAVDEELGQGGSKSSRIVSVKTNKDGSLSANSAVANNAEFEHLIDYVSGKIEEISGRIREGEIGLEPFYEQERSNACVYCDFRDICKFEAGNFGSDWRKKEEISKKEMEAEIYGRIQAE